MVMDYEEGSLAEKRGFVIWSKGRKSGEKEQMFLVGGKNLTIPLVCSCSGASRRNLIPNKSRHTQDLAEGSWKAENQCFGAFLFDKCLLQWHLADIIIDVCAKLCEKQLEGI